MGSNKFLPILVSVAGIILVGFLNIRSIGTGIQISAAADSIKSADAQSVTLPKMVDLGSKSCIPCKRMAPILKDLKAKYEGKAEVIFIDVKEDRAASFKYKITLIPTQIFFDTAGTEVYRHIGFFPADSIIAHFKVLGVEL